RRARTLKTAALIPLLLLAAAAAGCSDEASTAPDAGPGDLTVRPTPEVSVRQLRQDPSPESCEAFLRRLDIDELAVPEVSAELRAVLDEGLALYPEESAEVTQGRFTGLDAYHLADALMFSEAMRSAGLTAIPGPERAA